MKELLQSNPVRNADGTLPRYITDGTSLMIHCDTADLVLGTCLWADDAVCQYADDFKACRESFRLS